MEEQVVCVVGFWEKSPKYFVFFSLSPQPLIQPRSNNDDNIFFSCARQSEWQTQTPSIAFCGSSCYGLSRGQSLVSLPGFGFWFRYAAPACNIILLLVGRRFLCRFMSLTILLRSFSKNSPLKFAFHSSSRYRTFLKNLSHGPVNLERLSQIARQRFHRPCKSLTSTKFYEGRAHVTGKTTPSLECFVQVTTRWTILLCLNSL